MFLIKHHPILSCGHPRPKSFQLGIRGRQGGDELVFSRSDFVEAQGNLGLRLSRRRMLRHALVGGMAISAASMLVACGDDDDAGPVVDPSADDDEEPVEDADDDVDDEVDDAPAVTEGGRLVFGHNREPESLDPQKVTAVMASDWMMKIYDTVVTLDFDMTTIEAGLAESWEESEDGLTYTFHLQEGVRFHSGKEFTAEDVKYSIDRWLHQDTGSPTRHRIAGIEEVVVEDDHTVVFNLEERNNELLINLASGFGGILNEEAVEEHGDDYGTLAVDGTGPFILDHWAPREEAVLRRNEEYTWGPPSYENQGPAHVDELVLRVIPEDTTRILELQSGGVHIVPVVPPSDAVGLEDDDTVEIIQGETGSTTYLGMNLRMEIMQDEAVREALMHAFNKDQIADDILYGYALVAHGPVAPFVRGAHPDIEDITFMYDPDRANEILDEAGWDVGGDGIREKDGERLVIPIHGIASDTNREMMGLFSSNLADIGIEVESVLIEEAAIWARLAAGEHTIMLMGMPHTTPDEILMFYFHSDNQPAPNRFGFDDPDVDEWLEFGRRAPTDDEWYDAYHSIQERIMEHKFWLPLYHSYQIVGLHGDVSGFQYYGLYQMGSWKLLDVHLSS
jgi:peptide/nickel transport system substrate-binding protein